MLGQESGVQAGQLGAPGILRAGLREPRASLIGLAHLFEGQHRDVFDGRPSLPRRAERVQPLERTIVLLELNVDLRQAKHYGCRRFLARGRSLVEFLDGLPQIGRGASRPVELSAQEMKRHRQFLGALPLAT